MGIKGDKSTRESVITAELLVEKLTSIGGITSKKMFGGHGIFHEGKMFCIVDSSGHCYMKADESTKEEYEEKGSHQHSKMPYFSIPKEIMDNQEMLTAWAKKSIAISK